MNERLKWESNLSAHSHYYLYKRKQVHGMLVIQRPNQSWREPHIGASFHEFILKDEKINILLSMTTLQFNINRTIEEINLFSLKEI